MKKIYVKVKGGMANQLIQIFVALAIADITKRKVVFDLSDYSCSGILQKLKKNTPFKSVLEPSIMLPGQRTPFPIVDVVSQLTQRVFTSRANSYSTLDSIISCDDRVIYLNGYFHQKEFTSLIDVKSLDDCFFNSTLRNEIIDLGREVYSIENSVSIHVRRGDYLVGRFNQAHGACNKKYFLDAISKVHEFIDNPKFYIFSDDKDWVKENFDFVDFQIDNLGCSAKDDLYLMSKCRVNIISNSSFSWLSALMNTHENKVVISPKVWFKIDPESSVLNLGSEIFLNNELV